jgi:nucleoside-diphosphate-sugar epimerase
MPKKKLGGATVLVTGSSGFIGSHLCDHLSTILGCKVVGIDSSPPKFNTVGDSITINNPISSTTDFSFKQVDISNRDEIEDVYNEDEFDFVFHLAALANPRTCKSNFDLAFNVNAVGTKNIIEKSKDKSRLVFMSSAAVYGNPQKVPISETHPMNGNDPYAITKIMGEDLCTCFMDNYEHDICIGRNFNTFGERQAEDYIIPTLIKQALIEHRIEIWNSGPIRDFMYIKDALNALIIIAEHGETGKIYNIGTGKGIRIGELADMVRDIVDEHLLVKDLKKSVLGSTELVADNGKLCSLGWGPKVGFYEGLRRTVNWFKAANEVIAG